MKALKPREATGLEGAHLCQGVTPRTLQLLRIAPQGQQGLSCCHDGGLECLVGRGGGQLGADCCRMSGTGASVSNCQVECDRVSSRGLRFLQLVVGSLQGRQQRTGFA